jgi:DNA-binding NarL/FixJ family response regulator
MLVLLADDNLEVRKALRAVLEREEQLQICGEAVDGPDAVQKALELKPDLIILDYVMPRMNGLDVAGILKSSLPSASILLLTLYPNLLPPAEAQAAGISGIFSKSDIGDLLKFLESVSKAKAEVVPSVS